VPGNEIGQLLRKERFVWAEAQNFSAHEQTPLPLAMFNSDCFCRLWACNALDAMGRYDAGGYVVNFKPNFHHGGSFVSIALLTPSGEVRD